MVRSAGGRGDDPGGNNVRGTKGGRVWWYAHVRSPGFARDGMSRLVIGYEGEDDE